jgi:hypothetical protein
LQCGLVGCRLTLAMLRPVGASLCSPSTLL